MEGGQKYNIPLDSELDIHSSDMLVSVEQPKFQHNRQKYQGKYLPSSMRFEKDGWAAGNDVYQFNISEASVNAGSFTITKNYLNNNPSYKLNIRNSEGKNAGSVVYNPSSRIVSHDCESCSVSSEVNSKITGSINGKPFELGYDSISGELVKNSGTNIVIVTSIKSGYSMKVKLMDNDASILLSFDGMSLPDDIYNGDYLLGSFMLCEGSLSKWINGKYSCYYNSESNKFWIEEESEVIADSVQTLTPDSNGKLTASFNLTLSFIDNPIVQLVEFFPFFSSITASAIFGSVVQQQASSDKNFNKWSFTCFDPEHTESNISDKLYRNLPDYSGGLSDYNRQRIEQVIPVWFGISAQPMQVSTNGLTVEKAAGTIITSKGITTGILDSADTKITYLYFKTTASVQKYNGVTHKYPFQFWEHCTDKVSEYNLSIDNTSYTINVPWTSYDWIYDITQGKWIRQILSQGIWECTIDDTYSFSNINDIKNMISSSDNDTLELGVITITGGIGNTIIKKVFLDSNKLSQSPFYKSGSLTLSYYDNSKVEISGNLVLKGQLTSLGTNADYLSNLSSDTCAYWVRCCQGHIISDISIKSEKLLDSSLDASAFQITEVRGTNSNTLYVSDLFKHMIVQAVCQSSLSIRIYLCSKVNNMYMLYNSDTVSTDKLIKYCPGHIIKGSIKYINDSEVGHIYAYSINKTYDFSNIDTNYSLSIIVTGIPVKDINNNLYNYIMKMYSIYNNDGLIYANRFTAEVASLMQSALSWDYSGKPKFKVILDKDKQDDWNHLVISGQTIKSIFNSNEIVFSYDLQGSKLSGSGSYNYGGYDVSLSVNTIDDFDEDSAKAIYNMEVKFETASVYNFDFHIPMLFEDSVQQGWELKSLENNKTVLLITKDEKDYKCEIDFDTRKVIIYRGSRENDTWGSAQNADVNWTGDTSFKLVSESVYTITAVLLGVYNQSNIKVNGITASAIQMTVNDESISVDISSSGLFNPNVKSIMEFLFTNVNDEKLQETQIAELATDKEYQFLKQQWDTTNDTENFWWIDNSHVLVLTKSQIILRQKASNIDNYEGVLIDDWDGDVFVDYKVWSRSKYINSDILKYFCTSAYKGATAKFITVTLSGSTITLNIYDPLNDMRLTIKTVSFNRKSLGSALINNADVNKLNTYSELSYENVVSQAKWSGTCIDSKIIIGLHYDNNFNQWAIIIDNSVKVIHGYGFVGVNGCLTGGEIPAKLFDVNKGFNGIVNPLTNLSDTSKEISDLSELWTVTEQVVGTDTQQWYIYKNIPSIVSHIEYINGSFVVSELKINNNYSVNYDSASYCATTFSNYSFKVKNMKDLIPGANGAWTSMLSLFGWPILYFLDPKISVANYLQQTLGQAAYVHYNSMSIQQSKDLTKESVLNNYSKEESEVAYDKSKEESAILSDEISFDRQSVKQSQKTSDPYTSTFSMCAAALVSALDWGQEALQVNKSQNQSTTKDIGRKYMTNFLQNLNSMSVANMNIQSVNPAQTSEVTAIKTLDMFYSTCDKQQIQAGPGYVNHNFVAQCVSQSVTSTQSEFSQQRLLYIIGALSEYQLQITNKALEAAKDAIKVQIDSFAGPGIIFGGLVAGGNTTVGASIGLSAAWAALNIACNTSRIGLDLIPKIVNSLGGNKLNASIVSRQSKHHYDIEGKHKYGSKSECFMWPCFGVDTAQIIKDESVSVVTQNKSWKLSMPNGSPVSQIDSSQPSFITNTISDSIKKNFDGQIPYYIAMIKGTQSDVTLPEKMAYVIGTESFLATSDFKNENIGESEPVFPTAPFQDYIIDETWNIGQTASVGMTVWVSCKDTKVIDGELSNCIISDDFCGLAAPYTAIEVKRGIDKKYLRPWAVTPQVLGLNNTGLNCCFEEKAYHAFDGYGYRVVNWLGSAGMNKERQTWLYSFLVNDRFKRSNKLPLNEYLGNFKGDPVVAIHGDFNDKVFTLVTQPGEGRGLTAGTIGEDKDVRRYAIPVFSEFVNTLPAAVKTISAVTLGVIDGVTSLTTNNRDLQTAYKSPTSVDFTIGKNNYRFTQEYICSLQITRGVSVVQELVPCLGLKFIGSTPYEAYLYSPATRQYYVFTGGSSLQVVDMIERFRDVINGRYDFVNQEVLMPCLATFLRLDKKVLDDSDETDNVMIPRLKNNKFIGEVWPPLKNIFNTRSWFRTLSLPCGITYQGPNRCIINRFVFQDLMIQQVKDNYGKWKRIPREEYHPFRTYKAQYEQVDEQIGSEIEIEGWTHNPFLLVTAPIGSAENIDNLFEWEITFCWPIEMDKLYAKNNFATVNIQAENMTPGGKVIAERPVHVYLTKELFTRTDNYGYYSFRYQSKCGTGNRERLHIWSDQYICISSLDVELKPITQKRTEQLTQQVDIQMLKEI